MGFLDGKVIAVTGAGGGLGRAYALYFAGEGARIVVNDLGGSRDGTGTGQAMADEVADEIKALGGEAVANYASVADAAGAQSIIADAVSAFGKLDAVVNNAGILRDRTLVKMEEAEWDLVNLVHGKGTFLVTQAAVRYFRERGEGGRIVNTSSFAGLRGNFGQANYGYAKAGIAGFTRVVAMEGRKYGITCNAIAPVAKTRMTDDIDQVPDEYEPEDIAPLIAWLVSDESAEVTGRIFGAHGNQYFEYVMEMTAGVTPAERWNAADISAAFDDITRTEAEKVRAQVAAGGDAAGPGDRVRALFAALPGVYKGEKAGGWKATIHFDVKGTGLYSLVVADGVATFFDGAEGSPDGTVTFMSGDVLMDMAAGKVKPESAFMAGKIKADNMAILMSFARFFDMEAAAAALPAEDGGDSAAQSPQALIDEAFERMGEAFVAEKAAGWTTTLHFKVGADLAYTVNIADQEVATQKGLDGTPNCTISFDSEETFLGTIAGEIKPESAFMAGKIKADNMGELMRYSQTFDMKRAAAAAAAKRGPGPAAGSSAPQPEGLNPACVGRRYRSSAVFVYPGAATAYAAATDDGNSAYEGEGALVPPIYPVRPIMDVVGQAVADPDLNADLLRLVHGEQDMTFHRHLKPWDLVAPRAEIIGIEEKSSGQLLKVRQVLMCDGELVTEVVSGYFIRGEKKSGDAAPKAAPAAAPERAIVYEESQTVAADQPYRYGKASGDENPIHMDENTAKAAGHPSVILHGLCTMAFAGRAVVNGLCDGDPERLHRLVVRFSKPVLPGWTLTTRVWEEGAEDGRTRYGFETTNQDGVKVLANAFAEVRG
jgi:NAD(P)-dependent dehydrogenase (short-subunit alcohol dehydrogenase family)/acyl dehydratase/putative sterol carrier protein